MLLSLHFTSRTIAPTFYIDLPPNLHATAAVSPVPYCIGADRLPGRDSIVSTCSTPTKYHSRTRVDASKTFTDCAAGPHITQVWRRDRLVCHVAGQSLIDVR